MRRQINPFYTVETTRIKFMRKLFILVFGALVYAQFIHAQIQAPAVPFLMIAPDSRSGGMGEAGVALTDNVWASYWNPAGYAFQQGSGIAASYAQWMPSLILSDLWIGHLAYKQPVEELGGVVSAMVTYLELSEFVQELDNPVVISTFGGHEMAYTLGYATKLNQDLGIGVNARLFFSTLAPFGIAREVGSTTVSGISFDVGLLYKPKSVVIPFTKVDLGNNLRLGIDISNIGSNIYYIDQAQKAPLPMNLRLGFAYDLIQSEYNTLTWITDVNRLMIKRDTNGTPDEFYKAFYTTWTGSTFDEQIREFTMSTGLEYWYGSPKLIALRVGYFYEDPRYVNGKYMTLGVGLRYDVCEFDFSYIDAPSTDIDPLAEKFRFSLSIGW
jgi:Type IX secretion system protein PorV